MKESLSQYIEEYTKQLELGDVPKGYKALMKYLMSLRTHFTNQYPKEFIIGNFLSRLYGYELLSDYAKILEKSESKNWISV